MKPPRILPPGIFLIFVLAMWALHLIVPIKKLFSHPYNYIGVFFIVDGLTLVLWSAKIFSENATTIKPHERSSVLIKHGPYQMTRNPIYLGMTGMLLGVGMVFGTPLALALPFIFARIITQQFIIPEEDRLEKDFGDDYREYKARVRRWL